MREMIHRRNSACSCLMLSGTANCAVRNEIFRKTFNRKGLNLRDSRDGCSIGAFGARRYGGRYVALEVN